MRPLTLSARNLRTWETLDVEIPAGVTAIVGGNGAGKSSLVTVVDLALFADGRELRRSLTRGAEALELAVVFEHGGETYRVRRSFEARGSGKTRLDFERLLERPHLRIGFDPALGVADEDGRPLTDSWRSLTGATIAETEAAIVELLGITRQTFRASSYLAQGDGDAFTSAPPRERKAILLEAIGVRLWDRLHARAVTDRKTAETEATRLLAAAEQLEGQLALREASEGELRAAEQAETPARQAVEDLERGIEERRAALEQAQAHEAARREAIAKLDEATRWQESRAELVTAARSRIAADEGRLAARDEHAAQAGWLPLLEPMHGLETEKMRLRSLAVQLDEQAATLRAEAARFTREADGYVDEAARLAQTLADVEASATCQTCGQPLAGDALDRATDEVRQRLHRIEEARDDATENAIGAARRGTQAEREFAEADAKARAAEQAWEEARAALPELARGNVPWAFGVAQESARIMATLDEVAERLERDRVELGAAERALEGAGKAAADARARLEELSGGPSAEELRAKLNAAEATLRLRRSEHEKTRERVAAARARLEQLARIADEAKAKRSALGQVQQAAHLYATAERAFGRDGIPALILETSAIPQLETEANRLIVELGRAYRFELRTQRATQAGKERDTLDIVVVTETGDAVYEDFSGGERTRLDLALRIALARLLAARRGADVRLLTIDEPAYLDDDGFERLATVLRDLAGEFESVLVVSHVDTLRDAFDGSLAVVGGADTGEPSRIEEVPGD